MIVRLILLSSLLAHCSTPPATKPEVPEKQTKKMDHSLIRKAIFSHRKYISGCYGQAIMQKEAAEIQGTVFVQFKIGPDGKAFAPQYLPEKSSLYNEQLNTCLFAGLTSWDFPVHPEGLELDIRYPFQFQAKPPANLQKKLDDFQNIRRRD